MRRTSTGNAALDTVLGGGLVSDAINMVVGAPGSGKTILAEQCLFANATAERPGLYLSTASEPLDKLLRYGQALTFFDVEAVDRSIFYDDLGAALTGEGLKGVLDRVDELVKSHRPGMVVIDSFKVIRAFASDEADFRCFLRDLAGKFTALAISAIWVGEYAGPEDNNPAEFAVADTVIALETRWSGERSVRLLAVRKQRGGGFLSGEHFYRITADGIQMFPRLADPRNDIAYTLPDARVSSGVLALDAVLDNGYLCGSTTVVIGPSGVGKTVMGLHFVYAGRPQDETAVVLALQENRAQLSRSVGRFGWSIDDPRVTVLDRSPVDVYMDEIIYEVLDTVERTGARRVLIDALGDLALTASDSRRFYEFVYSFVQRCCQMGVTVMFTYEVVELFDTTRLSQSGVSNIADNIILLQYVRDGQQLKRTVSILKSRASDHSSVARQFRISDDGILLGDPIVPASRRKE